MQLISVDNNDNSTNTYSRLIFLVQLQLPIFLVVSSSDTELSGGRH